ncbi:MAG: isoleucine--tRNA ligase [Clostridia bacterium]|nr:isoleucine--tRNA ligase [Clostridia bacterium]MDH7573282.1 isoleucine--tRNA ligase [Clostridia bacterium]
MDYSQTVNLPQTEFPMRAQLPKREPEILRFWEEIDLYRRVQEKSAGRPQFILHDGPPYANGDIHLGTSLNKVLKDFIVKFYSMNGYDAPFVPGWDTHGLPIEQQAIKDLGLDRRGMGPVEFRRYCRDYALKYVEIQKKQFQRLGVRGDWDRPYLTLDPRFEAVQIGVFRDMVKKGYIYRGLKPVYWCTTCQTALADAEVEYGPEVSPSIYVKFPVLDGRGVVPEESTYVVIWTTTPWTLPANLAIALHPDYTYVLVESEGEKLVMAEALWAGVLELVGRRGRVVSSFRGADLEGARCRNPLLERESLVIVGELVTLEQGTGCVHIAPGHGLEDYEVGQRYGLPVLSPVDDEGRFTAEAGDWAGRLTDEANPAIVARLAETGFLLREESIEHQYPHCWRCKRPILFRATEQWFASVEGFRRQALAAVERVRWVPEWGQERMSHMIAERGDWCISRQRVWGVPIPIFYCTGCGEPIMEEESIEHVRRLIGEKGSDAWFGETAAALLPPGYRCPHCGGAEFRKETDIMDVWFDSGCSHLAVLETRRDLRWPADMYLEGSDQYRGWFNSSLCTSVAVREQPPYRTVLSHGYVVDEEGRKMSKSLGNGIEPSEVIEELGADVLRLWVASADYRRDVAASPKIFQQTADAYRKIRNTFRFLIGNLYDFAPGRDAVAYAEMEEIDRFMLSRLQRLVRRVTEAFREYEFHQVYRHIYNFCVLDLSAFYLDVLKDRLYCEARESTGRRSAQTALYRLAHVLVRLLTPILAFTTEEIWRYLPREEGAPVSVQLTTWPEVREEYLDEALERRWETVLAVREEVSKALEEARRRKTVQHSSQAAVELYAQGELLSLLDAMKPQLAPAFIVSRVEVYPGPAPAGGEVRPAENMNGLWLKVGAAQGRRCARCWLFNPEVGRDPSHPDLCPRCSEVVSRISA